MMKKIHPIFDFLLIIASFFGIIMGTGFAFIGITNHHFIIALLGIIVILVGLLSAIILFGEIDGEGIAS